MGASGECLGLGGRLAGDANHVNGVRLHEILADSREELFDGLGLRVRFGQGAFGDGPPVSTARSKLSHCGPLKIVSSGMKPPIIVIGLAGRATRLSEKLKVRNQSGSSAGSRDPNRRLPFPLDHFSGIRSTVPTLFHGCSPREQPCLLWVVAVCVFPPATWVQGSEPVPSPVRPLPIFPHEGASEEARSTRIGPGIACGKIGRVREPCTPCRFALASRHAAASGRRKSHPPNLFCFVGCWCKRDPPGEGGPLIVRRWSRYESGSDFHLDTARRPRGVPPSPSHPWRTLSRPSFRSSSCCSSAAASTPSRASSSANGRSGIRNASALKSPARMCGAKGWNRSFTFRSRLRRGSSGRVRRS